MIYEYAGFLYNVEKNFQPIEGQHRAAYKEKNRRNARSCYEEDKRVNYIRDFPEGLGG